MYKGTLYHRTTKTHTCTVVTDTLSQTSPSHTTILISSIVTSTRFLHTLHTVPDLDTSCFHHSLPSVCSLFTPTLFSVHCISLLRSLPTLFSFHFNRITLLCSLQHSSQFTSSTSFTQKTHTQRTHT